LNPEGVPAAAASGWPALKRQWGKDAQLGLFIIGALLLFRLLLIGLFGDQVSDRATLTDYLAVLRVGARFDLSTAGTWLIPTVLASLLVLWLPIGRQLDGLRRLSGLLFVWLAIPAFGFDLVFFDEYGDQFNQHIFGLVHDDTRAILITIWKSYHPLPILSAIALLGWGSSWLLRRWLAFTPSLLLHPAPTGLLRRAVVGFAIFLGFAAVARGGTLWGEPIRVKHAFIAQDMFLNRAVINPFTALREAFEVKVNLERSGGLSTIWPSGDLHDALNLVAEGRPVNDIDGALARQATGTHHPPRHIFMILMESQDGWAVHPAWRQLGFSPQLAQLAQEGIYFPNMLPVASGTVGALHALVAGVPEMGLEVNYQLSSRTPYPTALAEQFRRLGYRTRFFYGGFLGWQRLDSYTQGQGYDEIYGGGRMGAGIQTNEWGIRDAAIYDYILSHLDDSVPSFNFILTTANHPPYDLDLKAEGFPISELPAPLEATKAETLKVLGHLWYADREVGRFVRSAHEQLTDALFAITGDHTTRLQIRFPGDNQFEQWAVPFILYGPEVLGGRQEMRATAGDHLDINPTLVELAAPAGFTYHAFGQDLLHKQSPSYGPGLEFIVSEGYIANQAQPDHPYRLPGNSALPSADPQLPQVIERYRAERALAWQRVRNGNTLQHE